MSTPLRVSSTRVFVSRPFSTSVLRLALPGNREPPSLPRRQRGLPSKRTIPHVKHVVLVSSGKGGVGKSTVASNLALALSKLKAPQAEVGSGLDLEGHQGELSPAQDTSDGYRRRLSVGLLDLDIFGPSVPKLMGLDDVGEPLLTEDNHLVPLQAHGIKCMSLGFFAPSPDSAVVWRGMMVMKAVQQLLFDVDWCALPGGRRTSPLDVLVIDSPPGTGDVLLSLAQLINVQASLIVSTPQDVAIADVRKGVAMFRKVGMEPSGTILNMSHFVAPDTHATYHIFGPLDRFKQVCSDLQLRILAQIPIDPLVSLRGDKGVPIVLDESEANPVAAAYTSLSETVYEMLYGSR